MKGECLPNPCPEVNIFSLQLRVSLGVIQQPMPFTLKLVNLISVRTKGVAGC